jgi:hypothetical protein
VYAQRTVARALRAGASTLPAGGAVRRVLPLHYAKHRNIVRQRGAQPLHSVR